MNYFMEHLGFKAQIMEAERLTGEGEHGLPPGSPLPIFQVDAFKKHPENWMEGDGCFVVPVNPDKGLWFDWRDNCHENTAIVPTVKGCNPITGLRTNGYALERYENRCPKHDIEFKKDRYCEKCGYKWPAQNYVSSPNVAWWDGFRENDGTVRQFFFTAEMMRDIASQLIGKEDTVPAFGFAFYEPKEKRPVTVSGNPFIHHIHNPPTYNPIIFNGGPYNSPFGTPLGDKSEHIYFTNAVSNQSMSFMETDVDSIQISAKGSSTGKLDLENTHLTSSACNYSAEVVPVTKLSKLSKSKIRGITELAKLDSLEPTQNVLRSAKPLVKKEVAVGAGAKIRQSLQADPHKLTTWKDKPSSTMRIYFIFQEEFEHWKSFGMRDFEGKTDGMLNDLTVG